MTSFQNAPFDAPNDLYAKSAPKSVGPTLASSYDELDAEPFQSLLAMLHQTRRELDASQDLVADLTARLKRMEELATTDFLTGLHNRAGFDAAFAKEIDRTSRGLSKGGLLVIIDLDNFKMINDMYGHQAGDACLKLVAQTLAHEIRTMDTAARLGGDEFILLLSDADPVKATTRVQNMAWRLNNLSLIWHGAEIHIQGSVGMKPYGKGETAHDIFAAADKSMYTHKESRKKEVACAE
ncbi:MAG: GGDEF domain-containing protein [Pseudobdellovibrionaceae bacterium]